MQNERIKTEEHIEYDSDDSSESGSSSSSKSSHNKLEPEVYKTRKDENFTEYFKIHKNQVGVKIFQFLIYFPFIETFFSLNKSRLARVLTTSPSPRKFTGLTTTSYCSPPAAPAGRGTRGTSC